MQIKILGDVQYIIDVKMCFNIYWWLRREVCYWPREEFNKDTKLKHKYTYSIIYVKSEEDKNIYAVWRNIAQ